MDRLDAMSTFMAMVEAVAAIAATGYAAPCKAISDHGPAPEQAREQLRRGER
jgi:hypothetical protein